MIPLEGEGRMDASLAAALVGGNQLVIVAKGLDDQVYFNQGELGGSFLGWQIM